MSNEELVEWIQQDINTTDCMEQLYKQNKGYITKIARRYYSYAEMDDLMQEAYFGLYEAVQHYESNKEVLFMTYAAFWIKQAVKRYVEVTSGTIRLSVKCQELHYQYKKIVNAYMKEYNIVPSDRRVAYLLGVSEVTIKRVRKAMYEAGTIDSLDTPIDAGEDSYTLSDTIIGTQGFENELIDQIINY